MKKVCQNYIDHFRYKINYLIKSSCALNEENRVCQTCLPQSRTNVTYSQHPMLILLLFSRKLPSLILASSR